MSDALKSIINPALIRSRNGRIASLTDVDEEGEKAIVLYENIVETAMGSYPWPFMTKSVKLERDRTAEDIYEDYQYFFNLPPDYLHIWKFYYAVDRRPVYDTHWDFTTYFRAYTWPLSNVSDFFGGLGRLTSEGFNTDYNEMYVLYTPKPKGELRNMSIAGWTMQFREYVMRECIIAYEQGLSADAELSPLNIGIHEREKGRMKTQASIENRRAYKLDEPAILSRIRASTR